ncbi:hypothetical protein KEM54_006021 [Ascosphaera aggregata]|nr:hypothetical protein KEM54_006021 [Ascosphaera aggregata]
MPFKGDSPIGAPSSDFSSPPPSSLLKGDLTKALQSPSVGSHGSDIEPSEPSPAARWSLKFFDFPFEVRERIYRYALVPGKIFVKPFISFRYVEDDVYLSTYTPPNLALLRTSKGVYSEACFTFYRENTFCFVQPDILVTLLRVSPRRMRDLLKHMHKVEIIFDYRDYQFMTDDLCRGLQRSADTLYQIQPAASLDGRGGDTRPSSGQLSDAIVSLTQLRSYILGQHLRRSKSDRLSDSWIESMHAHNLTILRTYLWGRTLTFIAQNLLVTDLYLDFKNSESTPDTTEESVHPQSRGVKYWTLLDAELPQTRQDA